MDKYLRSKFILYSRRKSRVATVTLRRIANGKRR